MPNMDGILLGPGPLAIAVTKPYSSSYLWKNGEYCTQNGKIYKFISTDLEETGETWTPAHWAETKLTDEIIGLGQRIDSLDPESGVGLFTDIAFEINSNQWTEDSTNGVWNYNYSNSLIKATSGIAVYYDNSYDTALSGHIRVIKNTGYVTFTTNGQPQNRLTGTLRIVDSVSGVLPVSSGGTGAVTSKGARTNLNVSIKPICVNFGTVSSLPQTLTDINNPLYADINANMIPSKWVFGNPAACPNGLKCTTAAGAVTISLPDANSTFSGETTVYLELVDPQTSADSGTGSNDQQYTGDFVQIGAQSLTATQKAQARINIGAANAEDVSEIAEQIANIEHGDALFIGDSYSTISTGYTKALPELLQDIFGFENIYNYAVAGSGYVNGNGTNQHFGGQLDSAISALTSAQKANVRYVFILGGQNDYAHTVSNIVSELGAIFDNAKEAFENAKIVVLPLWRDSALSKDNSLRFPLIYHYAILKGCITDTSSWAFLITTLTPTMNDGVHPTQNSLNYLANCIANVVRGNKVTFPSSGSVVQKNNSIGITYYNPTATFDGENVHFCAAFTVPSSGIAANTEIFRVNKAYAPIENGYVLASNNSGNPLLFIIAPTGKISSPNILPAGALLGIDITWSLLNSDMTNLA